MEVLVVDDMEVNRRLLRSMLVARGYEVIEAGNGNDAIRIFSERSPAVVLMDIMMPGMNGYETTRLIKSISGNSYTLIIFVTALNPEEAIVKATEAGGDDFVCKPISFDILISKINAHLRIRELNAKLNQANAELVQHNKHQQHEQEIVEYIFRNALKYSWLDERYIRYYMSPLSVFNGDVLLAERRPDGGMCVLLGDFTGHGLPAAMGTLPVVKTFFTMVRKGIGVGEIASELNSTLKMLLPANMFCAAILVEMDKSAKRLSIWSGGLPPILLFNSHTATVTTIECQHMPLGILRADEFEKDVLQVQLTPGTKLYLYTDGIIETQNTQGEIYGFDRMAQVLVAASNTNGFDALLQDHSQFRGDSGQKDDLTLVELNCAQLPDTTGR